MISEEEAKKELEKIEYKNRTWQSEFSKQMSIWEEIAERINSCKGKEKKYWGLVMSLYNQKYK